MMTYKSSICRLALSVLEKAVAKRNFSSVPSKCDVRSLATSGLPLLSLQYLQAHHPKPHLVDPGFLKTPLGILDAPSCLIISQIVDIPTVPAVPTIPPTTPVAIEDPTKVIEQQAARLIVIRRRKMRRHKLRKLRKKMKFVWAKRRQRRELKKEKEFQAELMGKIKEAERFDATAYAAAKINKANEVLIPKLWKGKRLPEFVIKDLLVEKSLKHQQWLDKRERRKKMVLKVSEYKV